MTPSSEEIAAALEVAIRLCNLGEPVTLGESAKSLPVLRAHLSRLREEERFRDAALECAKWRHRLPTLGHVPPGYDDAVSAFDDAYVALAAARVNRALEEPRDG